MNSSWVWYITTFTGVSNKTILPLKYAKLNIYSSYFGFNIFFYVLHIFMAWATDIFFFFFLANFIDIALHVLWLACHLFRGYLFLKCSTKWRIVTYLTSEETHNEYKSETSTSEMDSPWRAVMWAAKHVG